MEEEKQENEASVVKLIKFRKGLARRLRKKEKRNETRFAEALNEIFSISRSGLKSLVSNEIEGQLDLVMKNHIVSGHNRKMKKKLKKIRKNSAPDEVVAKAKQYENKLFYAAEKKLFNPESLLEKRRQKRSKRLEANSRKSKLQVHHKKQEFK